MRILLLQGSFNEAGVNAPLADEVVAAAADVPGATVVRYDGLDRLPLYTPAHDTEGLHPEVDRLRAEVRAADAVVLVTPEHNAMPSAALKNALDLASRPYAEAPLVGKPVAILAASPTPGGGRRAIAALVAGLGSARARALETTVSVPSAPSRLVDGRYDEQVRAEVTALVRELVAVPLAA